MKLGVCTACVDAVPFEERLRVIADLGFDNVSLDFGDTWLDSVMTRGEQIKLCERYGLEIQAVHLDCDGMTEIWSSGAAAEAVTLQMLARLEEMKSLGLTVGVAHTTWGYDAPASVSRAALQRFERLAERAEKLGVRLALENALFPEHHHAVLDAIQSPAVGFCWDSGHENAFTKDAGYPQRYAHRLFAMHLHDNCGVKDDHAAPFEGTVDWKEKMAALKKTELFQTKGLTLEPYCRSGDFRTFMERVYLGGKKLLAL